MTGCGDRGPCYDFPLLFRAYTGDVLRMENPESALIRGGSVLRHLFGGLTRAMGLPESAPYLIDPDTRLQALLAQLDAWGYRVAELDSFPRTVRPGEVLTQPQRNVVAVPPTGGRTEGP